MFTVTDSAKAQLKRIKESRRLAQGKCLKLATPPQWTGHGDFGIVITDESPNDIMIEHEGFEVLAIDADLAGRFASAVLDWKVDQGAPRFTLDVY